MRLFSTCSRRHAGKVLSVLETPQQITAFINTSHGSLRDLLPEPGNHVDGPTVRKMLKLSGFEADITEEIERKWTQALNSQVGFINHLNDGGDASKTNASVFRPIVSDHNPTEALDLKALQEQVEEYRKSSEEDWQTAAYVKDTVKL